jgi:hypothetical protein
MPTNNLSNLFSDSFISYPELSSHYDNYLESLRPTSQDYLESIRSAILQEPTVDFSFDFSSSNRTDNKIKALEERIEKLEEMIGILLDKRG